jgi:hypothetical protein
MHRASVVLVRLANASHLEVDLSSIRCAVGVSAPDRKHLFVNENVEPPVHALMCPLTGPLT